MSTSSSGTKAIRRIALTLQRDLAIKLGETHELLPALQAVLDAALRLEGVDGGGVYVRNEKDDALELVSHEGLSPAYVEAVRRVEQAQWKSYFPKRMKYRFYNSRESAYMNTHPDRRRESIKAIAIIPIYNHAQLVATFQLGSRTMDRFPPATRQIIRALAAQLTGVFTRMEAERRSQETERLYRAITEAATDMISLLRARDLTYVYRNEAGVKILGYGKDELRGRSALELIHPEDRARILRDYLKLPVIKQGTRDFRIRKKDGHYIWVEVSGRLLQEDGKEPLVLLISRDITERKQKQFVEAAERESQRIGRDLHDGICQQLMGVAMMSKLLEQEAETQRAAVLQEPARLITMELQKTINQLRDLTRGLLPVPADPQGLRLALEDLADTVQRMSGVYCSFETKGAVECADTGMATHLYRMAQEACSNAIRHGHARRLAIQLSREGAHLALRVRDNGTGFDPAHPPARGLGLHTMEYRARQIGAALRFHRRAKGMDFICVLPLPRPQVHT